MDILLQLHLITILPVLILGPFILFRKRGDRLHVMMGRAWAYLMIISCLLTFGIKHQGRFGWLHLLSLFTIYSVVQGIRAIKRKDIKAHQRSMTGSYIGAVIAFMWAASEPGRLVNTWISSLFNS